MCLHLPVTLVCNHYSGLSFVEVKLIKEIQYFKGQKVIVNKSNPQSLLNFVNSF